MKTALIILAICIFILIVTRALIWIWLRSRGWETWNFKKPRRKYWAKKGQPRDTVNGGILKPFLIETGIADKIDSWFGPEDGPHGQN